MKNSEKQQIANLRERGLGYAQIAKKLGLSKGTVGTFCRRNGLGEDSTPDVKNSLLSGAVRGNTDTGKPPEAFEIRYSKGPEVTCDVTVIYAEEPDEAAVADVLSILRNTHRKE